MKRYCNFCGKSFDINPRLGTLWLEKTNRGRYCSRYCYYDARKGLRVSQITEFKKGKNPELHWNWKGGRTITPLGYIQIRMPNHPNSNSRGYIFEHRYIMEQSIGRYLKKPEVVHHINHDKQDNRIENLRLFESHSEHLKHERTYR